MDIPKCPETAPPNPNHQQFSRNSLFLTRQHHAVAALDIFGVNETSCYPRPRLKSLDIPSVQTELLKAICTFNGTPQSWDILGPFGSICLSSGRFHLYSIALEICCWNGSIMCLSVHTSRSKKHNSVGRVEKTRQCWEPRRASCQVGSQRLPFTRQTDVSQVLLRGTDCGSSSICNDGFCVYTYIHVHTCPYRGFSARSVFVGSLSLHHPTQQKKNNALQVKGLCICFKFPLLKMDEPASTCNNAIKKIKNAICKGSFIFRHFLV